MAWASTEAQTLKTYDGSYKGGNARYSYYDDSDGERIYHGVFTFTSHKKKVYNTSSNEIFNDTITGRFEHGRPIGLWYYKHKQTYTIRDWTSTEYWNRQTNFIDGLNLYDITENGFVREKGEGQDNVGNRFLSFTVQDGKLWGECILNGYGHKIICQATDGKIHSYTIEKYNKNNLVSKEVCYTDSIRYIIDNETGQKTMLAPNKQPAISLITLAKYNYFTS